MTSSVYWSESYGGTAITTLLGCSVKWRVFVPISTLYSMHCSHTSTQKSNAQSGLLPS